MRKKFLTASVAVLLCGVGTIVLSIRYLHRKSYDSLSVPSCRWQNPLETPPLHEGPYDIWIEYDPTPVAVMLRGFGATERYPPYHETLGCKLRVTIEDSLSGEDLSVHEPVQGYSGGQGKYEERLASFQVSEGHRCRISVLGLDGGCRLLELCPRFVIRPPDAVRMNAMIRSLIVFAGAVGFGAILVLAGLGGMIFGLVMWKRRVDVR